MTSTGRFTAMTTGGGRTNIDLGMIAEVAPEVAKHADKLRELEQQTIQTMMTRDANGLEQINVAKAHTVLLGDLLDNGEDITELEREFAQSEAAAREETELAQSRIDSYLNAGSRRLVKLQEAMDEHAEATMTKALKLAEANRLKLARLLLLLDEVVEGHSATMGLVHLLEARDAGSRDLTVRQSATGPVVTLSMAREHLSHSMALYTAELAASAEAFKPSKRRRAAESAEPLSVAPEAPQAPVSVPAGGPGFEIGGDDD